MKVSLRVGHEPEDSPRGIADAGYGQGRTVRIGRIRRGGRRVIRVAVLEGNEAFRLEAFRNSPVPGDKLALAVSDREVQAVKP